MWPAGSVDLEQAWATTPDLIVVSINGADSALAHLSDLQAIAPVIVVNYSNQTWQDLARQLGDALGLEQQAAASITGFDALIASTRTRISLPEEKSILSISMGQVLSILLRLRKAFMRGCCNRWDSPLNRPIPHGKVISPARAILSGLNMKT